MLARIACSLILMAPLVSGGARADDRSVRRQKMIDTIEAHAASTGREIDPRILEVMAGLPRDEFVPDPIRPRAYDDRPQPIGYGQTISQPFIVALMTDLLQLDPTDKVLDVGTGSAYQAAVLAELVDRVYSIEIVPELGEQAAARLARLGHENVRTRIGDGYFGWPEQAPFDAILVAAAASHIPPPLLEQLKPGGRMVIPVGGPFAVQQLVMVTRDEDGSIRTRQMLSVAFVPLTGER